MVWSGGTYKKGNFTTNGWTGDASLGIGIEAGRHDTQDDDFATGINQCLNKDGSNVATGNLNLNTNKLTNIGAGTARTDAAQVGQVQDGDFIWLGTTAGTAAAQTASATPAITAYKTGQVFRFISNFYTGSEAAVTLNVNGIGAKTCVGLGSNTPLNGFLYLQKGLIYEATYNGTNFAISNVADLAQYTTDAASPRIRFFKSRGADASTNTILQNGDGIGQLDFWGANGTGFTRGAIILATVDGTPGASNDMPTRLTFNTSPDGSGSPNERMRISANGNVGIGNASTGTSRLSLISSGATATNMIVDCYNSAPSRQFAVREDGNIIIPTVYFIGSGAAANVVIDASGFLYRSTSSLKYKENIQPLPYGLSDVLQLNPVTFSSKNENEHGVRFAGLIAEEVDAIGLNEFVQYAPDGSPDALHYGNMVSLAFKAIQELNAKVEALEARIAALEA